MPEPISPEERVLNRVPSTDPRNADFPYATATLAEDRPQRWRRGKTLDQGREGACVGMAWTQEAMTAPHEARGTDSAQGSQYAIGVYREAQTKDEWAGEEYSGTSVNAGAKVMRDRGLITGWRWAQGIEAVRTALIEEGPVVIGINWYSGMYATSARGFVRVEGDLVGGHAILLDEYHPAKVLDGSGQTHRVFAWHNSWGYGYGRWGRGYIRYEDLRDLLSERGDACVPTGRMQTKGRLN